jgi:tripartite-type tricarboxylate transporter receptor subunit TctC
VIFYLDSVTLFLYQFNILQNHDRAPQTHTDFAAAEDALACAFAFTLPERAIMKILPWTAAAIAICAAAFTNAAAQTFPTKTISLVLPLAAGSGMDTIARLYAETLQKKLGKPVIIENKPGAAFMLATQYVAQAPADGHTLLVATSGPMAIGQFLYKSLAYDPDKDFTPIALYVKSPFVLTVSPTLPAKTVPELIKLMKESKEPLTYVSPGVGNMQHLATEYMKTIFSVQATHVPYSNTPQSILDVASGHVNFGFVEAGASLPLIKDGKLRAIAVSSQTRLPILPEAPPFSEVSGTAEFEAVSWHMLLAPSGTPKAVVDLLHAEMKAATTDPEFTKKIADIGLIPFTTPDIEGMRAYLASERAKWGGLVRKLGLEGSQ